VLILYPSVELAERAYEAEPLRATGALSPTILETDVIRRQA